MALSLPISFGISGVLTVLAAWTAARMPQRWLLLLALALGILCAHATLYLPGTVDDSFITYRFARNWAEGLGPVYQRGEHVEGCTSFAWMALLALAARMGLDINLMAKVLGLVFAAATLPAVMLLAERLGASRRSGTIAPLVLALSPLYSAWVYAGMDAPFFAATLAWSAWAIAREDDRRSAIPLSAVLLGLSVWIRPEGLLFVSAGLLAKAVGGKHDGASIRGRSKSEQRPRPSPKMRSTASEAVSGAEQDSGRGWLRWALVAAALAAPFWIWRWSYYGHFFPNTFYAKTRFTLEYVKPGLVSVWEFIGYAGPALIGLVVLSIGRLRGHGAATRFLGISLSAFLAYVVWAGGDVLHLRFFVHILPVLAACAAVGFDLLLERANAAGPPRHARIPIIAALALVWTIASYQQDLRAFASIDQFGAGYVVNNSQAIQRANIPLGVWLHAHAPAGARLAVWDIGAIGYYSRLSVVDLFGLTDASIARLRRQPDGAAKVEARVEALSPELVATYSGPDSSVSWIASGMPWLLQHYRYHSHWRDQGPGTGPALLVRKDVGLPPR